MTAKYEMQFCIGCYMDEAQKLIRSLLETAPHDGNLSLTLVPGAAGSFEVRKDGALLFSKKQVGRLPTGKDLGISQDGPEYGAPESPTTEKCC